MSMCASCLVIAYVIIDDVVVDDVVVDDVVVDDVVVDDVGVDIADANKKPDANKKINRPEERL